MRTHIHQAGEPACPGHSQIEKNEIDIAAALEQFNELVECACFADVYPLEQTCHGFAQRTAKKWMIVSDHKPVLYGISQPQ